MARCTGTTRAKTRCKFSALEGSEFCKRHDEEHPDPRSKLQTHPDEVIAAARAAFLSSGGVEVAAARRVGVGRGVFNAWLSRGRTERAEGQHTVHTRLLDAMEDARGQLIAELSAHVTANALHERDNRLLMSILRRLDPDEFTDPESSRSGAASGGPAPSAVPLPPVIVQVNLGSDIDAEVQRILDDA